MASKAILFALKPGTFDVAIFCEVAFCQRFSAWREVPRLYNPVFIAICLAHEIPDLLVVNDQWNMKIIYIDEAFFTWSFFLIGFPKVKEFLARISPEKPKYPA
jgi:hypothetical protein